MPAHETDPAPVTVERVSPRWFGLAPATVLLVLAAVALLLGIALVLTGRWIAGLLVLGLALLLAAAFLEVGRRKPDAAVVKASVDVVDSVRAHAGFAARAVLTGSAARQEIARRRAELVRLQSERETLFRALGEAVYEGAEAAELRARISELDARAAVLRAEAAQIAEDARARVQQAHLEIQPTEVRRRESE